MLDFDDVKDVFDAKDDGHWGGWHGHGHGWGWGGWWGGWHKWGGW